MIMTRTLLCCFFAVLLLVCSSAEEEIQGKGVFVNKKDKLLEKKVPADEAVSDYLGDFIMSSLLQQFAIGDYSFLKLSSIQLGLCDGAGCERNFLYYKRPLYDGMHIPSGGVKAITGTKAHIEQFALIVLADIMIMNSDRFALPGIGDGNENNILWHKTKQARNSVLLPIDNGWGALFLLVSHNMKGQPPRKIEEYLNAYSEKFRRLVQIIADADDGDKKVKLLAKVIWNKNKGIFYKGFFSRNIEIKKDEIITTIVNFWMKNRRSVAEKIKLMMKEQLAGVVIPQLDSLLSRLGDRELAVFGRKEEGQLALMQVKIEKNLGVMLNSRRLRHAAAYAPQREAMYYDEEFEDEIERLYRMKSKQLERALRKAWRNVKNNDLSYS